MLVGYICVPALTCLQIIKNTAVSQYVVEQKKQDRLLLLRLPMTEKEGCCPPRLTPVLLRSHRLQPGLSQKFSCVRLMLQSVSNHQGFHP